MVVERDEKWMPAFDCNPRRSMHPSTSAPAGRLQNGGSVTASASNDSDDDEASSSFNITNRCSPKSVFLLVAKFSEFKKQLIRDSGFGGIIDIPCIRKLNLKLSSWLLSKLDTEESCLVFGPSRSIYIHEADVGIVLGIPNGEIDISTTSVTDEQLELLRSSIGLAGSDVRSIKGIDYVLEKHLDDQSSSQEVDSFKVAFVVFIIAHLLAPCVKHDQVQLDFWGALKNPSTLDRFNWCRYVYGHLLEAAQKARAETINKGRCTSLLGCHYFLQVLFLDNVDLSRLNKSHNVIPRLKMFDQESLRTMAVMCASRGEQDFAQFVKIRSPDSSVYMRHTYQSPHKSPPAPPSVDCATVKSFNRQHSPSFKASTLTPDTFAFKSPTDFAAYVRQRHPGLERTFFVDYIKNHNALMMKDIYELRSSIMRRNAYLVDWLVDNCGASQLQMVHRKPLASTLNPPGITPSPMPVDRGQTMVSRSRATPLIPKPYPRDLAVYGGSPAFSPRLADSGVTPQCLSNIGEFSPLTELSKRPIPSDDHTPAKKLKAFNCMSPPSFNLGDEFSPTPVPESTTANKRFANEPFTPSSKEKPTPTSIVQIPASDVDMSPTRESKHLAQSVILDIVHVTEGGIDPTGKVLYSQLITEPFEQIILSGPLAPLSSWSPALRQSQFESTVLDTIIECCNELSEVHIRRAWIVHPLPRYLLLTGSEITQSLIHGKLGNSDVIDGLIRRLNQLDMPMQCVGVPVRWRHFFETDFSMHSLAGYNPQNILSVYNQFVEADYSIPNCQMLVVPVLVDSLWCCYMFDIHSLEVHILDPAYSSKRYKVHIGIHRVLHDSLRKCMLAFYKGWTYKSIDHWKLIYPKLCSSAFSSDDSATVMLYYARNYNGVDMGVDLSQENMARTQQGLLLDLLTLQGNTASPPESVKALIQC